MVCVVTGVGYTYLVWCAWLVFSMGYYFPLVRWINGGAWEVEQQHKFSLGVMIPNSPWAVVN